MGEELLDVVDENDTVVGRRTLGDCLKEGLLHRAVVIFLWDALGRVYLQKRSNAKAWYPGYWSASCTGHVSSGESYLEGARRELREELGLKAGLCERGKFLSPRWRYGESTEREFNVVFEGKVASNVAITHGPEVADGKWVRFSELRTKVRERAYLTPDTILAFEACLADDTGRV